MNFTEAMCELANGYSVRRSDWTEGEYICFDVDLLWKVDSKYEKTPYNFTELDLMSLWFKIDYDHNDSWGEDSWNDGY